MSQINTTKQVILSQRWKPLPTNLSKSQMKNRKYYEETTRVRLGLASKQYLDVNRPSKTVILEKRGSETDAEEEYCKLLKSREAWRKYYYKTYRPRKQAKASAAKANAITTSSHHFDSPQPSTSSQQPQQQQPPQQSPQPSTSSKNVVSSAEDILEFEQYFSRFKQAKDAECSALIFYT